MTAPGYLKMHSLNDEVLPCILVLFTGSQVTAVRKKNRCQIATCHLVKTCYPYVKIGLMVAVGYAGSNF